MSKKLKIRIHVPFATALRHGFAESGYFILEPTEQELRTLTVEERQLLAEAPRNDNDTAITVYLDGFGDSASADFSAVRPLLAAGALKRDAEVAERAAEEARKVEKAAQEHAARAAQVKALVDQVRTDVRAVVIKTYRASDRHVTTGSEVGLTADKTIRWEYVPDHLAPGDQDVLDLIKTEFHRRLIEKEAAEKAAQEKAEREQREDEQQQQARDKAFICQFGSAEQIERHNEGFLPEVEFLDLVRDKLFECFSVDSSIRRFVRLTQGDVEHTHECCEAKATFDSDEATELESAAFAKLKHIRAVAQPIENVTVKAVQHTAMCDECGEMTERHSALVTVTWNHRKFSREYAL
jgi:hypothetical protein